MHKETFKVDPLDPSILIEENQHMPTVHYYFNKALTKRLREYLGNGIKKAFTTTRHFVMNEEGGWDGEVFIIQLNNGKYTYLTNSEWAWFNTIEVKTDGQ